MQKTTSQSGAILYGVELPVWLLFTKNRSSVSYGFNKRLVLLNVDRHNEIYNAFNLTLGLYIVI